MPYTPSGFFCDRLIRERERRDGEGSLNKPVRFNGQDYGVLRQECVHRKSLFEDDSFPATVESLGYKELGHKSNKVKNIVWKRPKVGGGDLTGTEGQSVSGGNLPRETETAGTVLHTSYVDLRGPAETPICSSVQEICENPQFIVGGASRTDICQGDLGKLPLLQ